LLETSGTIAELEAGISESESYSMIMSYLLDSISSLTDDSISSTAEDEST